GCYLPAKTHSHDSQDDGSNPCVSCCREDNRLT
ncbi:hypothetical protein AVDCRST_MAG94-5478, partial [uncultured Leptolyngbya sp.]